MTLIMHMPHRPKVYKNENDMGFFLRSPLKNFKFSHDLVALYTLGSICSTKRLSLARYLLRRYACYYNRIIDLPRGGATDGIFLFGGML